MIEYTDELGETVTLDVASLITGITASASKKRSDGNYGSNDSFQSLTATIPPGSSLDGINQIATALYDLCEEAVSLRLETMAIEPEDRRAVYPDPNPGPDWDSESGKREQSELDEYFPPNEGNASEPANSQRGDEYPLITQAPGASNCKPSQKYSVITTEYRRDDSLGKVKFYQQNAQWPAVDIAYPSDFFTKAFGDWEPVATAKGDHKPLHVKLFIECTGPDKLTKVNNAGKGGNPYRNIQRAESIK